MWVAGVYDQRDGGGEEGEGDLQVGVVRDGGVLCVHLLDGGMLGMNASRRAGVTMTFNPTMASTFLITELVPIHRLHGR